MPTRRESLRLTLPPDPGLAYLARLVTLHFLRQNGMKALESRRKARLVEKRFRALLRASPRSGDRRSGREPASGFILRLVSGARDLEVTGQIDPGGYRNRLVHLRRPEPA